MPPERPTTLQAACDGTEPVDGACPPVTGVGVLFGPEGAPTIGGPLEYHLAFSV